MRVSLALQCLYEAMLSNKHDVTSVTQNGGYICITTITTDVIGRLRRHGFMIDEDGLRLARTIPRKYG